MSSVRTLAPQRKRCDGLDEERLPFPPNARRPLVDDRTVHTVITLRVQAPDKPAPGAPCNGCGVCCAVAPCPLGIVVSRKTRGACAALVWIEDAGLYRCGLIERPARHLPRALRRWAPTLARIARRYVSAGSGCDSDVEAIRPPV